jgi:ATP-dependent helicase/nuclease subunit B
MPVTFVIGRAGSGKTTRCVREIVDAARADPLGPAILWIVPKQQTFMAERMLACESGLGAVCRVRVLSFDQLATEALAAVGGAAAAQVTALGRQMIVGHLLRRLQPRLNYYRSSARQIGLAAELDATFGEIERSGLTNGEMEAAVSELETHRPDAAGTSLLAKLRDLRLVYDAYRAFLGQDRLDPHRRQTEVLNLLRDWPLLRGATVYVDGFLDFSDDERRTLAVLAAVCRHVRVTLPIDPASPMLRDPHRLPEDMSLFRRTEEAYRRLWFVFAEAGEEVNAPVLLTTAHRFRAHPVLAAVERLALADREEAKPQAADPSLHFLVAPDRTLEVETVARHVRMLLNDGLRLRDVAVLARNLDDYAALVDSTFREHGIAYFVDRRRTAGHHPLLQFVRSALQIARFDWPHESVMALLKTGLACLGPDEADELEDYVLLHRVRGGTAWETAEPWTYRRDLTRGRADQPNEGDDAPSPARAAAERVDQHRRTLHDRLRPLIALARAKDPPLLSAFVTTLLETLEACSVRQTLSNWMRAAADAGDFEQHDEHAQVWAELNALLGQMNDLLGDEPVNASEFAEILESGLERFDLAITPPTLDQVLVGQVDRTRTPPGLRACFVLGLCAGDFPRAARDATVLTDADRRELRTRKLDLGGDSRQTLLDERLLGYLAFTRASEHLFVSRPLTSDGDRATEPSVFWQRLRELFPEAPVTLVPPQRDSALADAWTPRQFATCLMEWARGDGRSPDGKEAAYQWLAISHSLSPVLRGEGRGEGRLQVEISNVKSRRVEARTPTLSPGYRGEGECADRLTRTLLCAWRALGYANDADLSPHVSRQLFPPPLRATAARLETFAACAFRHFLRYGLSLTEREPPGVTGVDLSRVYHHVLQALVSAAVRDGVDLTDPKAAITDATIASLVADVGRSLRGELMISSARNAYLLDRVERTLREVVAAHREMLRRGSMRPARSAMSFGTGGALPAVKVTTASGSEAAISGTIDRLDALPDGSGLAVYDYRLGSRQLSLQEVYHGLSLQLLTGLLALQGTGQPAAAFYLQTTRGTGSVKHPSEALDPSDPKFLLRVKPRGVVQGDFVPAFDASLSEGSSEVIQVSIRKSDGGFGNRRASDVADKAEFEALLAHVRKKLGDLADAVLSGEVGIHPYRIGTDTPCPGCGYRAVCRFDPAVDHYRNFVPMGKEQVFKRIIDDEAPTTDQ